MHKLKTTALAFAMGLTAMLQTGCFGTFALTRKAYEFHDGITENKFIKSLLFWIRRPRLWHHHLRGCRRR